MFSIRGKWDNQCGMTLDIQIRASVPSDTEALEGMYPQSFPDEDLLPVLRDLLSENDGIISLVAELDGDVVGHVIFSMCEVGGKPHHVALLGPLCVHPGIQKQGVGSTLVESGFQQAMQHNAVVSCVLGDPDYYGRFGFKTERDISPPYDLPNEWETAWQSKRLTNDDSQIAGILQVPAPWQHPKLWLP